MARHTNTLHWKSPVRRSVVGTFENGYGGDLPQDVLRRLEHLDDTIFEAINGSPTALDQSSVVWRRAVDDLGCHVVEESRRQYLRRARAQWQRLKDQISQPVHKSFAALEIIALLG